MAWVAVFRCVSFVHGGMLYTCESLFQACWIQFGWEVATRIT